MNFFLLLNTKEDILKNVSNQTVDGPHWLPYLFSLYYGLEVNDAHQLFSYPYSSKYLPFCSAEERNSYRFETTWGWVYDDRIFILKWTIPLMDQVLPKKVRLQPFLENGHGLSRSGWVRQIIPPAGNSHGKGQRKRFSGSLRWHHKTTFACRAQVSEWHISLK